MDNLTDRAIDSIVTQFKGGEHRLAGMRASELVYGNRKQADEKLLETLKMKAPGIERYVSAPESPVEIVEDQGGNPLATQPENDQEQLHPSNVSSEQAKQEQDEVDKRLEPGRERREKAGKNANRHGSTKLNPAGSDRDKNVSKPKPR